MRSRIIEYLNDAAGADIFNWLVPSPSVIYAITFIIVVAVLAWRCKACGLQKGIALDIGIWGGIAAIVVSRLAYMVLVQGSFPSNYNSIFTAGGTTSWGVYTGSLLGAYLLLRFKKQPVLKYLDVMAATLPLGTFMGRWSCFMYGCDYGTVTNVPWAVSYPAGTLAHATHINEMLMDPTSQLSLPVHPNQIYLSISALLVFFLVTWFWKKYRSVPGMTLGFYGLTYCTTRFMIEFFRNTSGSALIPSLNLPQVLCIFAVAASVTFMVVRLLQENLLDISIKKLKTNKNMGE